MFELRHWAVLLLAFGCVRTTGQIIQNTSEVGYGTPYTGSLGSIHPQQVTVQGTVTFADWTRKMVVIQNGDEVRVLKINSTDDVIGTGDHVALECECTPFIPAFPDFPDQPARQEIRDSFESPTETGDFYLARMRGFLHPPVTGSYTFWIASDDSSALWLSESEKPEQARRIAAVPETRYTDQNEWRRIPSQQSQEVHLEAGKSYYIEALQQEYKGRDFVSVAWQGPGSGQEVIPGRFMSPWTTRGIATGDGRSQGILWEYWTNFFTSDLSLVRSGTSNLLKCVNVRVLSREPGEMPEPVEIPLKEPLDSRVAFHLVKLEGRVEFVSRAGGWFVLELSHGESRVTAKVRSQDDTPVLPNGSLIWATGFLERIQTPSDGAFGGTLWLDEIDDITWLDAEENWSRVPQLPQHRLSPDNPELAAGQIVHAQGRVAAGEASGVWRLQGGDTFFAYTSTDGTNWSALGLPVELQLSNAVLAGIALASSVTGEVVTARFDRVSGLPRELSGANVGNPPLAGGFRFEDRTLVVEGNGEDVWHQSDQCFFAYHPRQGDFQIVTRLAGFDSADARVKAVVMVRESLAADSRWVGVAITPNQRIGLQARREVGADAAGIMQMHPARWLKLVRQRNSFFVRAEPHVFRLGQNLEVIGQLEWRDGNPVLGNVRFRVSPPSSRPVAVISSSVQSPDGLRPVSISRLWAEAEATLPAGYRNPLRSKIGGVVTFEGDVAGKWLCFVQDGSGSASLQLAAGMSKSLFRAGHFVEMVCTPLFTGESPVVLVSGAADLGQAQMPAPTPVASEFPGDSALEGQWVEIEGVVRSAVGDDRLNLMSRAGSIEVRSAGTFAADYINSHVRARGVFWRRSSPMLLLPSEQHLEVLQPSPVNPFSIPSFAISSIQTNRIPREILRRTKTTGVVTCLRSDFLIVQDATGGIRLETSPPAEIEIGDEIQAVGFHGRRAYGDVLTEVLLQRVGSGEMHVPIELSSDGVLLPKNAGILASVEATMIAQHLSGDMQTLDLQLGQFAFRASLPKSFGEMRPAPKGSLVRLTGIIVQEGGARTASLADDRGTPMVGSLEVMMRQPADVVVLQRPPWWNWKHTVAVCGLLLAILGMAVLWIRSLRQRVEQRTHELQVAMGRLEKETRVSATLAERDRLAAEIHDSVEQGLSAIVMQMEAASEVVNEPDEVKHYLTMVKNMAGFSRAEVQHAVWDMQSPLLENADLATALQRVAQEISAGDTPRVTVEIVGEVRRLASNVEHHLLRIAQEAITNAVKHGNPRTISLLLRYTEATVRLVVRDDGMGFDAQATSADGRHFGLHGMRSRAQKIDAALRINSEPGDGTCVELVVPVPTPVQHALQ